MLPTLDPAYDAIVVGARVAGAATAMLLARAGAKVLAVDRQAYGSDTLSTHALMRPAVIQLARWGLLERLLASGAPVIETTTFHYGIADEVTVPIRAEPGIPGLLAPRRTVLDRTLVDAARRAGATVVHDVSVTDLVLGPRGRVRGVVLRDAAGNERSIAAGHVVGADGIGSAIVRKTQAATLLRGTASVAHIYGYSAVPRLSGYHWYFADGLAGALIPTNDGLACTVVSVPTGRYDDEFRFDLAARRHAALARLAPEVARHGPQQAPLRAFRGAPGFLRQPFGPGWVLVGDAGFFRDPLTSHGISDALRDAEGAATAILAGTHDAMRRFQEERDGLAVPILEATDAVAGFDWTLGELPGRHRRFSEAMKPEIALLASRAAAGNSAFPARAHPAPPLPARAS